MKSSHRDPNLDSQFLNSTTLKILSPPLPVYRREKERGGGGCPKGKSVILRGFFGPK